MSNVVVLGCGPAGLAAAITAFNLGHKITIASKEFKMSEQFGCQYLHAPIQGFENVPKVKVKYRLIGTPEQYRKKVYGEEWLSKVSPEDFVGDHEAWDIRETYRRMFQIISDSFFFQFKEIEIVKGNIDEVRDLDADKIISTIPAVNLCSKSHTFIRHMIYAKGSMEQDSLEDNNVLCVGTEKTSWYRSSNVFGYRTVEWPAQSWAAPGAVKVMKPLSTNCDCNPGIIRVGRYGAWQKSFLVHQVPGKVEEFLSENQERG